MNAVLFEQQPTLVIPERLGRYRVIRPLGAGAMGEVYLAEDPDLGREVALKVLRQNLATQTERADGLARLEKEACVVASLNHPSIVTLYALEQHYDQPVLVMESIAGQTLSSLLQERAPDPLPLAEVLALLTALAEALSWAHQHGVVHRDLKPGNLMLTADGRLKVLDFGVAAFVRSGDRASAGTPAYMAPEQLDGSPIDPRMDLFALGMVALELLLASETPARLRTRVDSVRRTDLMAEIRSRRPQLDDQIIDVLVRCTAHDPGQRPEDAEEVLAMLRATVTRLERDRALETTKVPWVRHPILTLALALVLLCGLIGLDAYSGWTKDRSPLEVRLSGDHPVSDRSERTLAVLPFENLGPSENQYFTAGLTEEITTRLTALRGVAVVSADFDGDAVTSGASRLTLAERLGVDYVVFGTVRWSPSEDSSNSGVRITARLMRTRDRRLLSSQPYTATMDRIFEMQQAISERFSDVLETTLVDQGSTADGVDWLDRTTTSEAAYRNYLLGVFHLERGSSPESDGTAVLRLEQAVAEDPSFYLAWGKLAEARSNQFLFGRDRSMENRRRIEYAAQQTALLAPGTADAALARGFAAYIGRDWEEAHRFFSEAARLRPGSGAIAAALGFVARRQGRWSEASALLSRAIELAPGSAWLLTQQAQSYVMLRRYGRAREILGRAIEVEPEHWNAHMVVGLSYLLEGNIEQARSAWRRMPETAWSISWLVVADTLDGRYDAARSRVDEIEGDDFFGSINQVQPKELVRAFLSRQLGDVEGATLSFGLARRRLELEMSKQEGEVDPELALLMGLCQAGSGDQDAALEAARQVEIRLANYNDAASAPRYHWLLAQLYSVADRPVMAMEWAGRALQAPSSYSFELLLLEPLFENVRKHPRFPEWESHMAAR